MHGFELLKEQHIPELNTKARLFRHMRSGARLLSMENDDENKVFGISFRTPAPDSTGVAHIMEHSVLCGSRKYPVKEPFVELVKGSLNTFLNAFTYPDRTCYPVASQNLQDFYNLMDVYMDAVLYPLIPAHILQQEGWHYELESLDAPLTYKGVVFNEMKGAYSDPEDLLGDNIRRTLFPDNTYRFDSGGDPCHIPELTYEQFKAFHAQYYHPANAYIYIYGDDDPQERLRRMDEYLQAYQAIPVASQVALQPRFPEPQRHVRLYDPGEDAEARKGWMVMNWMLPEASETTLALGMSILNHILIGTPASPLRKALIDSGLGEDLTGGGLEADLRQMYFSVGLKGMAVSEDNHLVDEEKLAKLILETLEQLAQEIDPQAVAASMNTVEFRLRENNTGAFPRGLLLMLRALRAWLYDGDPIAMLAFDAPLVEIKQRLLAGEAYFEGLIRQYFLENMHRTTFILQPQPGLGQQNEAEEKQRLETARAKMSAEQLQVVWDDTQRLKQIQSTHDTAEALATIPGLNLADLERQNKLIPMEMMEQAGCKGLYHDLFTNGVIYLDVGMNLHSLPQEYLPYVPLFGRALAQLGTEKEDFVHLLQHIGRTTGGIVPRVYVSSVFGARRSAAWLFLRSKAMTVQADELLAILRDILLTVRLDNPERFRQMVLEEKADQEAMLVPAGNQVVNTRLRSLFDEAGWVAEQINGIDYLFFLRQLAEQVEQDWSAVLANLETMRRILLNRSNMLWNVTLDQANWKQFQPRLAEFWSGLPDASMQPVEWLPNFGASFEGLTIPAQVNYVGKGANLYALGYLGDGSIDVILKYLNTTWMWERVRVQGGAYGGRSVFNQRSGVFTSLSYRDPNLLDTLAVYDQSGEFLRCLDLDEKELTRSIVGAIGDLDAYQLPDAKGYVSMARYLAGETDEYRQRWREQALSTTVDDFHAFGEVLECAKDAGLVVVLGGAEGIEKANAERGGWLDVKKVL